MSAPTPDPAVARRPQVDPTDAEAIALEHFGIRARATPLPGERDRNFALESDGARFVLKIAPAAEDRAVLDFQHAAIAHVAARDAAIGLPQPLPATNGATIVDLEHRGARHAARLLTWLDGTPLVDYRPHTDALCAELGAFLGRLDAALHDFEHPAMRRDLVWDLRLAPDVVRRHRAAIDDAADAAIIDRCLARFAQSIAPTAGTLRCSVIHNDANDHNVLITPSFDGGTIAGLIDLGDAVHSYTIGEVAIAAAYAMLDIDDPLAAAAALVGGYHRVHPLHEVELAALFDLIAMRLCTSVALSAQRRALVASDAYLAVSEAPAWRLLRKLDATPAALAHATFRDACGLDAHRDRHAVTDWLRAHPAAAVVDADLEQATVLDLGVGSLELEDASSIADLDAAVGRAARQASVVVGRYDEPRLLYQSDSFADGAGSTAERRTIHLGIDLFADVETPIHAPYAGTVHTLADNAGPLDYGPTIILRHRPTDGIEFFTLYGHLSRASLDGLRVGGAVEAGARIATIGEPAVNGGWPPHVHFQVMLDALDSSGDFPGVAPAAHRGVWLGLCPDPNLVLRIPPALFPHREATPAAIGQARRDHLSGTLSLAYRRPLHIVRGRGRFLYDAAGRPFLDAVNNVPHVGHCHPHVVRAGQRQMAVLNTNTRYLHAEIVRYAERLLARFPDPLEVCFFVCSGSEANELALRLARAHTGARDCIVLDGAYHGHSSALIDLSPYKHDGPGGSGAPEWVHTVPTPDTYRGPYRADDARAGERYAAHVADAIEDLRARGRSLAAFFAEPMLGCGGQVVPPPGFLAHAFAAVRAAGGVCIADEVQVGFGRAGSHFAAFAMHDVVPDVVTLGKPMGNGHPIAAVVTTRAIAQSFDTGMEFFATFGGNPVSCAIGAAVLDVLEDEDLQHNAAHTGAHFLAALRALAERHVLIGDVRGQGLYLGIELVRDRTTLEPAAAEATYLVDRMKDLGVLLSTDGPLHNVIKIKPPLVFTTADADHVCALLDQVLSETVLQRGCARIARNNRLTE